MNKNYLRTGIKANSNMLQRRLIIVFVFVVALFAVLVLRIGYIQVIATETYASRAAESQTKDVIIPARRGAILDRNMNELAISTGNYRVFVRLQANGGDDTDSRKVKEQKKNIVDLLSTSLEMDPAEITTMLDQDKNRVIISKDVDKNAMDLIRDGIKEKGITLIEVEEDVKREYPMGPFASQLLGTVGTDGIGKNGIEYQYNEFLSGIAGRQIGNTDVYGNPLNSENQISYEQQDGLNLVLTIDENIQHYVESAIKKTYEETEALKVTALVMDPKTGDVFASAEYPEYDPNKPSLPTDEKELEIFNTLSSEEQGTYLNNLWKSSAACDTYEPGSVFKLITVASALETGSITPEDYFNCEGSYEVEDRTITCHVYPDAHGYQDVTEAVANSCNPAMIQISRKMGYDKFYQYLELFGITAKANIDYPGEAAPLIQEKAAWNNVGLATMSYGMGLNITPIQMITAVSAIGNEGKLMQPRFVKGLADNSGKIVQDYSPKIVRQVISKQTSDEVKKMMEYVINSADIIDIPGYKIGGKTGTALKLKDGEYSKQFVGSMLSMAPMDDPKFVVLVVVDEPKKGKGGSDTAGPAVEEITKETLRYMNIMPEYTKSEQQKYQAPEVTVPDVSGKTFAEAITVLDKNNIQYVEIGNEENQDVNVVDQYPKGEAKMSEDGLVYLYAR